MTDRAFAGLRQRLGGIDPVRRLGRVSRIGQGLLEIAGIADAARQGDGVVLRSRGETRTGEIVGIRAEACEVFLDGRGDGVRLGDEVMLTGPSRIAPDSGWIGRVVDPDGRPLDGRPLMPGPHGRSYVAQPPAAAERRALGGRLEAGLPVFNTFLPIARGQRVGLFAGSGVGKSSLLGALARNLQADVVVIGLIGERGREVRHFVETVLGPEGMARSVVVAATSDQSALTRRRCAWACMAVAEHFSDAGMDVLLLADSVTRFAEAHRDIALACGEAASLRDFPPSMPQSVMELVERAGPGAGGQGDITAIFTVLVAGADMEGPVADTLRGTLDGHVILDRQIAERGRYPAVDLLKSVSRSLPEVASERENALLLQARRIYGAYERAELMIQSGLYTAGSDSAIDEAIAHYKDLEEFLSLQAAEASTESFDRLQRIVRH